MQIMGRFKKAISFTKFQVIEIFSFSMLFILIEWLDMNPNNFTKWTFIVYPLAFSFIYFVKNFFTWKK
jgi:hypothetical protein